MSSVQGFSKLPSFPLEIIDQIVDHLHDDPPSLRACALTSRMLRPASQYHLFSSLKISSLQRLQDCVLLLQQNPKLTIYVRELHYYAKAEWQRGIHPTWINDVAPALSSRLQNICILSFDYVEWGWPQYALPNELVEQVAQFRNVTELRLYSCHLGEYFNIDKLTTAFPSLSRLHLDLCKWLNFRINERPDDLFNPTLSLKSIHFGRLYPQYILMQWLEKTPSMTSLKDVSFNVIEEYELPFLGNFLRALGPSIERLRLGFNVCDNTSTFLQCESHNLDFHPPSLTLLAWPISSRQRDVNCPSDFLSSSTPCYSGHGCRKKYVDFCASGASCEPSSSNTEVRYLAVSHKPVD